ncbi:hypothetical protein BJV78DRAFT_1284781 [Lactifluus subvellereus]|nr:hypothetical protein BJV78DRAFT_1284781 [Lactifluus subvellereus]
MSQTSPASPVGGSGVFQSRMLNFLAGQRPSVQEERGNRRIEAAYALTTECAAILSPSDLLIARERITLTKEIRIGSDTKNFFLKYLQLREYNKSAKDALWFVKVVFVHGSKRGLPYKSLQTVSQRAKDSIHGQSLAAALADTDINTRLRAEIKPRIATLVESMYAFDRKQTHESISYNAQLAQTLLKDMNFVYPVRRTGSDRATRKTLIRFRQQEIKDGIKSDRYRHPIIQEAINIIWFRDYDDVGVVNRGDSSLMPISVIALTLTVVVISLPDFDS